MKRKNKIEGSLQRVSILLIIVSIFGISFHGLILYWMIGNASPFIFIPLIPIGILCIAIRELIKSYLMLKLE